MCSKAIYRCPEGEEKILALYESVLKKLDFEFGEQMIDTRYGVTHVLITGPKQAPPLIILQGGNTVSPVTLSWFLALTNELLQVQ
jgi:hypothetical protein